MNRWLGIDGALGAFSAALIDESGLQRTHVTRGNDALERGLGAVDAVLGGIAFSDLSGIAVGTGPGGFTGLRIAVGYAKSLALAAHLPLAGISSYDALEDPVAEPPFATFVHGREGIACVRFTAAAGAEPLVACGPYADLATRLAAVLGAGATLRAFAAPAGAKSALGERGLTVIDLPFAFDVPALGVARRALAGAPATSPHAVHADYGETPHYAAPNGGPK